MKLDYKIRKLVSVSMILLAVFTNDKTLMAQCNLNQEVVDICQTDPEWKYSPAIYPVCAGSQNPDGTDSNGLPPGEVGLDYSQDFTVVLPDSIYYDVFDIVLDFNYAILTNPDDIGLPPGMNLVADPNIEDWTLEGSTAYCLELAGAPQESGSYPLSLVLEFCAAVVGVETCIDTTINCYGLEVVHVANEDLSSSEQANFSPNPVQQTAQLNLDLPKAQNSVFRLYDLSGNLLREEQVPLHAGKNQIDFDRGGLGAGMYLYALDAIISGQVLITH